MSNQEETVEIVAIIIPVYNEEQGVMMCYDRLMKALEQWVGICFKIIFVDCGSTDLSFSMMQQLMEKDQNVEVIQLTRRFGKEAALTAGIDRIDADAMVLMDADLQHPPELINNMIALWKDGFDHVVGQRKTRESDAWWLRIAAAFFYRLFNLFSATPLEKGVADFRLLDRAVVQSIRSFPERRRFMKGLFAWAGYAPKMIEYDAPPRLYGVSRFNLAEYLSLAADGLMGASSSFLKISLFTTMFFFMGVLVYVLYPDSMWGSERSARIILMFGMLLQMISVTVLSLYVGRIHWETKQRPLYVVKKHHRVRENFS